jgi:hypothetical protein
MELAIVSGRGPDVLTNIGGFKPLVRDEDLVLFGCRDEEQAAIYGSQSVHETNMHVFDFEQVRKSGVSRAASLACRGASAEGWLTTIDLKNIWKRFLSYSCSSRKRPTAEEAITEQRCAGWKNMLKTSTRAFVE